MTNLDKTFNPSTFNLAQYVVNIKTGKFMVHEEDNKYFCKINGIRTIYFLVLILTLSDTTGKFHWHAPQCNFPVYFM